MLITKELCLQILNKAKDDEFIWNIPKDEEEIFEKGVYWINQTLKARADSSLKWDKTVIAMSNIIATHRIFTDEPSEYGIIDS